MNETPSAGGTVFRPHDMWCPDCFVAPGIRCVEVPAVGLPRSRRCHLSRYLAAEQATKRSARKASGWRPGYSDPPRPPGT